MTTQSLIAVFGNVTTATLNRQAEGSYSKGIFVDGPITSETIKCSIQPVSGKELLLLPEGDRVKESLKMYSEAATQTGKKNQKHDTVTYMGETYDVRISIFYFEGHFRHYKSILVRRSE